MENEGEVSGEREGRETEVSKKRVESEWKVSGERVRNGNEGGSGERGEKEGSKWRETGESVESE